MNWKREHQLCAEKGELESVLHEKAEIINFGVNLNMLVTFYNAVICSLTVRPDITILVDWA